MQDRIQMYIHEGRKKVVTWKEMIMTLLKRASDVYSLSNKLKLVTILNHIQAKFR